MMSGNPRLRRSRIFIALGAILTGQHAALAASNPAEVMEMPTVNVVGTTPLPGLGTALRDVPANVQSYSAKDINQQRQTNLGEYLEQNPTSVSINSTQGNPFQADVNFRGFTASPILGTPQGLSVFLDGVRINEPFGDVVNWDLIPQSAISSLQLIPGSNPAFGLNTLGGALAIYTKSGSAYPGGSLEAYGGSFGRKSTTFEYGGKNGELDYFVTANDLTDKGWAEHNPSTVRQLFGKLGWQNDASDLDISIALANNSLQGTQTIPLSFMDNIRQPYTWPDRNDNRMSFVTAKGSHFLTENVVLGGNLYYRKYRNSSFGSNVNNGYGEIDAQSGLPDLTQATNDLSAIDQTSYGLGGQITVLSKLAGMDNQLIAGASADIGHAHYTQQSQDAAFTADRGTIALNAFSLQTDARTISNNDGLFFNNSLKLNPAWTLTTSGRYDLARVKIEDETGLAPLLNAEHSFSRFNPAVGINFSPTPVLTTYASYNEGMRAPTAIELACADPDAPCKLPNNFVADPALKKIVARTLETGARGKLHHELAGDVEWSAAIYRTELADDIQFISAGSAAINAGYFQNVGATRRDGVELAATSHQGGWELTARYSYVDATYQTSFAVNSPNNSSANPATAAILVSPGNHIPGIPRQSLKLHVKRNFSAATSVGASINLSSGVYARGDENNQDSNGKVPGYTVINLDASHSLGKSFQVFARVTNLLDRRASNFGILAENQFAGPGHAFSGNGVAEQFRGQIAPRGMWAGVRYQW